MRTYIRCVDSGVCYTRALLASLWAAVSNMVRWLTPYRPLHSPPQLFLFLFPTLPATEARINLLGYTRLSMLSYLTLWRKPWALCHIPAGGRTRDLWIRSPTRFPLRHRDSWSPTGRHGRTTKYYDWHFLRDKGNPTWRMETCTEPLTSTDLDEGESHVVSRNVFTFTGIR